MAEKQTRDGAKETFRQFAWNLAGTLAERQAGTGKSQAGRPARSGRAGTRRG